MPQSMFVRGGVSLAALLVLIAALNAAEPGELAEPSQPQQVTVAVARDRAQLLHGAFVATLEVLHDRYFHDEKAIVPARALEDVFAEMARQQKIKAPWISVNTKAMSVGHEPKTEFEQLAAKEIAAGKESVEQIEAGEYRRAAPVPLASGCIACHTGFFKEVPKSPRLAGLVISMPLDQESK